MNNNLCFYQKIIPKYRESFLNHLAEKLSKNKDTKLILIINKP